MAEQPCQLPAPSPELVKCSYTIYGLRLDSTRPIPGALKAEGNTPASIFVSLEGIPDHFEVGAVDAAEVWYRDPEQSENGEPVLIVWRLEGGAFLLFRYADGTEFVVDRTGATIWAGWPTTSTLEATFIYLLGPILGFVLRLRGLVSLHASVLAWENQAFAIMGPGGAGKSTTAAALAMRDVSVLADDVAAIIPCKNGFEVPPGYSWLRLWPTSASILFGSADHLPKMVSDWDKCYLALERSNLSFLTTPRPLQTIYFLDERSDAEQAPFIERMFPRKALLALITNTYANYLLAPEHRAHEFEMLSKLMSCVRMRRVVPHTNPERLDTMCHLILEDFRDQVAGATGS
jgi:hypothetical protein